MYTVVIGIWSKAPYLVVGYRGAIPQVKCVGVSKLYL